MSDRFEAEAIIRAAASGAIPAPGDVLLRVQDGWVFANLETGVPSGGGGGGGGGGSVSFAQVIGTIFAAQVPESVVTQHEGALAISFTQLTDQIAAGQVPKAVVFQHLGALLETVDWLISIVTNPVAENRVTRESVLQHLREQIKMLDWLVSVHTSPAPFSAAEKLYLEANYG